MNVELFCITAAMIIVVTGIILGIMEERDRAKGYIINPEEYRFGGLLWIMVKERISGIAAFIKKHIKKG